MPQKQEIVLASLYKGGMEQKMIARFNRQNDQYHITIMAMEDDDNWDDVVAYRNRLQMELTTGGGPDILDNSIILNIPQYAEKGYLEDLSDVIPQEDYLKAALDYGRLDGKLYAAPYEGYMRILAYSRDLVGDRSELTLMELMQLVEKSDIKVLVYGWDELRIIRMMALYDESNKIYIDLEKGISHLNEEPFRELILFAQKYADDGSQDLPTLLKSGGVGSIEMHFQNPLNLEYAYACFPDCGVSFLGYPREDGNGTYLTSGSYMINGNSKCKEGAKEFIRFVMSEETQRVNVDYISLYNLPLGAMPVSIKALDYQVEKAKRKYKNEIIGETNGVKYKETPLNDEQVEQYYYIVNHSTSLGDYPPYFDIIEEELPAYLNGDKSLDEVTEIIHKRVQLYLDEQR